MSSAGNKNFQPTHKRLLDARREGNVAHSRDLSMLISICVFVVTIFFLRHQFIAALVNNYRLVEASIAQQQLTVNHLSAVALQILQKFILLLSGPLILAACAAGFSTVVQLGGFLLADKIFKFDLKKFNPVENAKQVFSKKNFAKFFLNILQLGLMFWLSADFFINNLAKIILSVSLPLTQLVIVLSLMVAKLGVRLLAVYACFALLDLILERRKVKQQLMMSQEDVEKEQKETEGNQEVKGQRRELHKELLADNDASFAQFKDSMLVMANPTHIAIVLLYLPQKWRLPLLLYKAQGAAAQSTFQFAKRLKIPIIRERWLARQIFALGEINRFIPPSLAPHVAVIIAKNLHLRPRIAAELEQARAKLEHVVDGVVPAPPLTKT